MWYKQARQFKELKSDHIYWRNKADRLENSIMSGEDIPIEKIMEFKKLTEKTYNNNGWYDSAMLRYNDIKKKWVALQNKKEKEQQQQVEPESESEFYLGKEIAANLQEHTMKINSNTINLKKDEHATLEEIIKKIASINGINNIESINISLTPNKGLISFKKAKTEDPVEKEDPDVDQFMSKEFSPKKFRSMPSDDPYVNISPEKKPSYDLETKLRNQYNLWDTKDPEYPIRLMALNKKLMAEGKQPISMWTQKSMEKYPKM